MVKTVRQVIKLLQENGFEYVSTRGDHHKFRKKGVGIIIVNGKLGDDMANGTLDSILRKAGLK